MTTVMDTNIPQSNSLYNIPQNDFRNNSYPSTPNQFQNQSYSYPQDEITYLPQNQATMINNQYPTQNQQIIQQAPTQYSNLPIKKLSIDTSGMTKTAQLNSAPPQINTNPMNPGSPYYIPSPRRRRGDHTNYETSIRAFFGRTKQHCTVYDMSRSKSYVVIIDPKVDRGFFVAENIWTCYRRNYFQISTVFNCFDVNTNEQVQLPCLVEKDKKLLKVNSFSLGISARVSNSDKNIDIIQHTPKRDKGPQVIPKPKIIKVGGNHSQFASIGNEQSIVTFERLQFKTATANNGKRRAAQQYYVLVLDLIANTEEGEVKIASIESDNLVVRGRSPGHYNDISLNTAIPQTVNMSSSASPAEGRYGRYPLTPTYNQYSNSPMLISPNSPASPGMPFHPGNQTPIQAPHSMLRQPPLNYSSPQPMSAQPMSAQPMSAISSNPGTPTHAGTPLNMAVTTAAGMPLNNGYAVKDDSTPYYNNSLSSNQNMNMGNAGSQNPSQNPNGQNPNDYYDNSQSASSTLYMNQPAAAAATTTTPSNQPQNYGSYYNQPQQPQQYDNATYYQAQTSQSQPAMDPYNNNTQATYQSTSTQQSAQNIYINQPQTPTQGQYVNQPYSTTTASIQQQNQYTMPSMAQTQAQTGTPQTAATYLAPQPQTPAAYLTPPQAATQQTPPPQTNNYINTIPSQTQGTYMDSPQPKLPPLDKPTNMGNETVDYLNSPSSNKNDMIDPINTSTNPPIASSQHNEISSLTSK